jgi:hypothetical protein
MTWMRFWQLQKLRAPQPWQRWQLFFFRFFFDLGMLTLKVALRSGMKHHETMVNHDPWSTCHPRICLESRWF